MIIFGGSSDKRERSELANRSYMGRAEQTVAKAPVSGTIGIALLATPMWLITDATPFPGPCTVLAISGAQLILFADSGSVPHRFSPCHMRGSSNLGKALI